MNIQGLRFRRREDSSGWTLLEMMIVTGISVVLFAAVFATYLFLSRGCLALSNYNDLDNNSRNALDVMTRDIRAADSVISNVPGTLLIFSNLSGTTFSYKSNANVLLRTYNGATSTLLTNLDYWSFALYQGNPQSNFTFAPSSVLQNTKLVDMTWRCSRQILGKKVNTESVQTAKIVLRN